MTAKLKTHTLGCKVNQYETQYVREGLLGIGYQDAADGEPADLCIVNTCTVTNEGDAKSRQIIRRMHRKNPACPDRGDGLLRDAGSRRSGRPAGGRRGGHRQARAARPAGPIRRRRYPAGHFAAFRNRHRAYVKVQDGCLLRCSYCIIPSVRPQMYSRPMIKFLTKCGDWLVDGYREVVLTGIHLGHYGVDFNRGKAKPDWMRLSRLVEEICKIPGDFRIRLSSIEATEVTAELIEVMAEHPRQGVCPSARLPAKRK